MDPNKIQPHRHQHFMAQPGAAVPATPKKTDAADEPVDTHVTVSHAVDALTTLRLREGGTPIRWTSPDLQSEFGKGGRFYKLLGNLAIMPLLWPSAQGVNLAVNLAMAALPGAFSYLPLLRLGTGGVPLTSDKFPLRPPAEPPVSNPARLLADDSTPAIGTGSSGHGPHPTSKLGVIAQIDDGGHGNDFGDLHLVGPGNATAFLKDPSKMYLGM